MFLQGWLSFLTTKFLSTCSRSISTLTCTATISFCCLLRCLPGCAAASATSVPMLVAALTKHYRHFHLADFQACGRDVATHSSLFPAQREFPKEVGDSPSGVIFQRTNYRPTFPNFPKFGGFRAASNGVIINFSYHEPRPNAMQLSTQQQEFPNSQKIWAFPKWEHFRIPI